MNETRKLIVFTVVSAVAGLVTGRYLFPKKQEDKKENTETEAKAS